MRLSEITDVNRGWPPVNALAGSGRTFSYDQLALAIPPLRDQGTRQVYRNLRRFFTCIDSSGRASTGLAWRR